MQPSLTYSWIALTASAPVILLLTCWALAVFHCRRRQWTGMDVFLVAILSQSILQQFLGFLYSALILMKISSPLTGEAVCTGMMWFFIAIPIFKGTTIASLAVDRWLFCTRFSYRLSIRKSHIRYHTAVLAIFSCTVGFMALITFNNPELLVASLTSPQSQYSFDLCTFLPFKFDLKFVIFYLCVHCVIVLVGACVLCKASWRSSRNNARGSQLLPHHHAKKFHYKRRRSSPPMDVTPTLSNTSTASSTISNGSPTFFTPPGLAAKAVLSNNSPNNAFNQHQLTRNQTRPDFFPDRSKNEEDSRISSALGILILSTFCTHLAFIMATILSRFEIIAPIPNASREALSPFNWPATNVLLWLQVIEGLGILLVLLLVDSTVPIWIFNRKTKEVDVDVPPSKRHQSSYAINVPPAQKADTSFNTPHPLNNKVNGRERTGQNGHSNPAFTPEFRGFPLTNGSLFGHSNNGRPFVPPAGPGPSQGSKNQGNKDGTFVPMFRQSQTRYDSIREVYPEDDSEYDRKSYHQRYASVASVTTVANDDFEFHQSRPSIFQQRPPPTNEYDASTYVVPKPQPPPPSAKPRKQPSTENKTPKTPQHIYEEFDSSKPKRCQSSLNPPTSLSMNDLDLIDDTPHAQTPRSTGTVEPYQHKQRMYRKRGRIMHPQGIHKPLGHHRPLFHKSSDQLNEASHRRVSSMECLSPGNKQTDHRNFLDISYLDTGEILVRKADSGKCIFVTDFL